MHRNSLGLVGAIAIACLAHAPPAQAQSVEEFYRGHQVQLLIGFPVSNAYEPMAARSPGISASTFLEVPPSFP